MKNATIAKFSEYNFRRYSRPWVGTVEDGKYMFDGIGTYTGDYRKGESGDLVVFDPKKNIIYAFGQKDYQKSNKSVIEYRLYDEKTNAFVECDKIGRK
jgi:hypothetical protein